MLSSSSSSGGSGQDGSSSSSSFIMSSSSGGSLHVGQLDSPMEEPNSNENDSREHHSLDVDGIFPPYILLDEDHYEETVESIRMASALTMPTAVNNGASRNPSRPASPCRQTRISEILARIDQLLMGATQSHQAVSSQLGPSIAMQTQKHRHLVALVEQKIAPSCSEEERASLYNLVSSVDQSQSKWAHPERLGQAELYSSLEKVLNELRAFTPYSVPFSTRVSRKDVPDYYEVIKRPMDLGTMMRKLKAFVYNSKREFQADLQKIYNNCFTYNTDPNSQLRLHVTMLKDKWIRLMAEVPEIEIRIIAAAKTTAIIVESSNESSASLSTSASQVRVPDIHLEELLGYDSDAPTNSEVPLATIPERTPIKMGVYHKARLKAQKRQKRRAKELFYPELVLPYQAFPDGWSISAKAKSCVNQQQAGAEEVLTNFEYWRRLRAACSLEFEDGDTVMAEPSNLKLNLPVIDGEASLPVLQRSVKSLIALMLVNIGFEAIRSDAMNMLKDLLLSKVLDLIAGLQKAFNSGASADPLANVRSALFRRDSQEPERLKLYAENFVLGRRRRLEQALARLSEFRAEQRERAYQLSLMEIDVVKMDGQSQDDLDGGDDLESVALDDEDLLLEKPTPNPDLDIFGLGDGTMNESTMTAELLALPKRSFGISSSGLEAGGLDPIQFIGEPPLRRLDED